MKLGSFMMPLHPPEKSRTQCYDEDVDLVVHADEIGFSEFWCGQHHTLGWEPIPANDVFLSNLIARTKNIKLATGVSIIPHHHPANIAVRLALLDHLSHGRIICGFGQSGVPTDWELFDLPDPKTQGLMTVEGIDMVTKLWQAEAPFDFKGQFWHIKILNPEPDMASGILLKPFQQPHPPIAMSIVRGGSMAARMAGQRGYIPVSSNLVPIETVATHWNTYSEGAAEAGQPVPDRSIWRISRSILVGESDNAAWDHALNGSLGRGFAYLLKLMTQTNMLPMIKGNQQDIPDSAVDVEFMMRKLCIIGSKATVKRRLEQEWETTGGYGTLLMIAHDWDDRDKWLKSMDALNEVVAELPSL